MCVHVHAHVCTFLYLCVCVSGFMTYVVEPLFSEWARFSDTRLSQTMLGHLGLNKASWSGLRASGSLEEPEPEPDPDPPPPPAPGLAQEPQPQKIPPPEP